MWWQGASLAGARDSAGRAVPGHVANGAVCGLFYAYLCRADLACGAPHAAGPARGNVVSSVCGGPAWCCAVAAHPAGLRRAGGHAGRAGPADLGWQLVGGVEQPKRRADLSLT